MKQIILNGSPIGYDTLENIKAKYPGAKILALPFIIDVITKQ